MDWVTGGKIRRGLPRLALWSQCGWQGVQKVAPAEGRCMLAWSSQSLKAGQQCHPLCRGAAVCPTCVSLCGATGQGERARVWMGHQVAGGVSQAAAGSWWALQGNACISSLGFWFYGSPWAAPKRKTYHELSWVQGSRNSTAVTTPIYSLPSSLPDLGFR